MTLSELFEAACSLEYFFSPDNGWYSGEDDGDDDHVPYHIWNHWSGAVIELKDGLARRLTDAELAIFSLSLDYGSTPGIDVITRARWGGILWPQGNNRGGAISPLQVIEKLAWSQRDQAMASKAREARRESLVSQGFDPDKYLGEPMFPEPVRCSRRR